MRGLSLWRPLLVMFGGADTFITVGRATCTKNRFDANLAAGGTTTTIDYCYNAATSHRDFIGNGDADYLISWIAAKAGIAAAPAECTPFPSTFVCPTIPNDYRAAAHPRPSLVVGFDRNSVPFDEAAQLSAVQSECARGSGNLAVVGAHCVLDPRAPVIVDGLRHSLSHGLG